MPATTAGCESTASPVSDAQVVRPIFQELEFRQMRTKKKSQRFKRRRRGVLTFEWLLLITVVVIGIVGGLSTVRDALINELDELAAAVDALYVDPDAEME
jgi:Flp pilus assembly pilin Flp